MRGKKIISLLLMVVTLIFVIACLMFYNANQAYEAEKGIEEAIMAYSASMEEADIKVLTREVNAAVEKKLSEMNTEELSQNDLEELLETVLTELETRTAQYQNRDITYEEMTHIAKEVIRQYIEAEIAPVTDEEKARLEAYRAELDKIMQLQLNTDTRLMQLQDELKDKNNQLQKNTDQWMERLQQNTDQKLGKQQKDMETKLGQLESDTDAKFGQQKTDTDTKLGQLESDTDTRLGQLESDTDTKLGQLESDTDTKLGQLESDTDTKLGQLESDTDTRLGQLEKDTDTKLGQLQEDTDTKLGRLQVDSDTRFEQLLKSFELKNTQDETTINQLAAKVEQLKLELQKQIDKLKEQIGLLEGNVLYYEYDENTNTLKLMGKEGE